MHLLYGDKIGHVNNEVFRDGESLQHFTLLFSHMFTQNYEVSTFIYPILCFFPFLLTTVLESGTGKHIARFLFMN